MSETCPILTLAHLKPHMEAWHIDRQAEIRCKTGRPVPLVEIRIVDEEMNDLPHDGVSQGEMVVRAPWLTQGYLKDPANSEKLWAGGWLHTGDIAVIDEEGYLKITDRLKDVIKTGGEWVSSLDLEDLILKHPGVVEAAVIGVPDPKWTERPLAVVVVKARAEGQRGRHQGAISTISRRRGVISKYGSRTASSSSTCCPRPAWASSTKKCLREQYPE